MSRLRRERQHGITPESKPIHDAVLITVTISEAWMTTKIVLFGTSFGSAGNVRLAEKIIQ